MKVSCFWWCSVGLAKTLSIKNPDVTVAGQTAPPPGIKAEPEAWW